MGKCLYNGKELPALPDWDREAYPFAIIYYTSAPNVKSYVLSIGAAPQYKYDDESKRLYGILEEYRYIAEADKWISKSPKSDVQWLGEVGSDFATWTSVDILYEDGSVAFAASDPVPVSTYTPNPAAMAMGILAGQAVRKMRK